MAKISNKTSYPSQNSIVSSDYLIGTSGKATDNNQSKTFLLGDIANFTIGRAFDGTTDRIPVFSSSATIKDSIMYQSGNQIYINNGDGDGDLFVVGNIALDGMLSPQGGVTFVAPIYDRFGNNSDGQEVLVSRADGTVEWKHFNGSGLKYQSAWNASTNTPNLQSLSLDEKNGNYWVVNVAGSTPLNTIGGGSITDWKIGDWVIISEDASGNMFWDKLDNSPEVMGSGLSNQLTFWSSSNELSYASISLGSGDNSFVFSSAYSASGDNSVAFGQETVSEGNNSVSFGYKSTAVGENSIAAGSESSTDGDNALAFGKSAIAESDNAIAFGRNAHSGSSDSIAMGRESDADADDAIAIGYLSKSTNKYATAIGFNNKSSGYNSYTLGSGNKAEEELSLAIGVSSSASADKALALGYYASAKGFGSIAMGYQSLSANQFSFSLGTGGRTESKGFGSVAIGNNSLADGANSYAFGLDVRAGAHKSHAYGVRNNISVNGVESFAIGSDNSVIGANSVALGSGLYVNNYKQIAIGTNNETIGGSSSSWSNADNLLVLGNGKDSSNKSNALEVTKGGRFRMNTYGSGNVQSEYPTYNLSVDSSGNIVETNKVTNTFIINGMVNNLGNMNQGLDFMEWTSNVTSSTQIPLWRTPLRLRLVKVTWAWMGDGPITAPPGSSILFSIGSIPQNQNPISANYAHISDLFSIDNSDSGNYASGEFDFTSNPVIIPSYTSLGVIGSEQGTVGPNSGELSISFLFEEDSNYVYVNGGNPGTGNPAPTS